MASIISFYVMKQAAGMTPSDRELVMASATAHLRSQWGSSSPLVFKRWWPIHGGSHQGLWTVVVALLAAGHGAPTSVHPEEGFAGNDWMPTIRKLAAKIRQRCEDDDHICVFVVSSSAKCGVDSTRHLEPPAAFEPGDICLVTVGFDDALGWQVASVHHMPATKGQPVAK